MLTTKGGNKHKNSKNSDPPTNKSFLCKINIHGNRRSQLRYSQHHPTIHKHTPFNQTSAQKYSIFHYSTPTLALLSSLQLFVISVFTVYVAVYVALTQAQGEPTLT